MPSTPYHSKFHLTAIAPVAVTPLPLRSHPPPVVLADAGTHPRPPQRACPWEDGDDNPSFVPAPFRYSRPPSRCPRACGDPSPSPAKSLPLGRRGRQSIFRPSSLPLLPPPCPRGCGDPSPSPAPALGRRGRQSIFRPSSLPLLPPPPVVLADAGTHPRPPRRACPWEDGDDNPSFVPAPFRYSRPPSRCPRACGDPSPSPAKSLPLGRRGRQSIFRRRGRRSIFRPSSLPLFPPLPLSSRMRGPIPREEPALGKTETTIHPSSQLPSVTPAPLPLSSRMRGPIFPTPPHHPQPALGASLVGALPIPVPIRPPSPPSYSFPLTFRRRRGRRNASYTATQSSIDVLPTASPISSNGRSSSFRNRTQDFPMFIRFPVAL